MNIVVGIGLDDGVADGVFEGVTEGVLDKFVESNGHINSEPKSSPEPVITLKHPKNQWARPDSNRRPPPCQGGRFRAFCAVF